MILFYSLPYLFSTVFTIIQKCRTPCQQDRVDKDRRTAQQVHLFPCQAAEVAADVYQGRQLVCGGIGGQLLVLLTFVLLIKIVMKREDRIPGVVDVPGDDMLHIGVERVEHALPEDAHTNIGRRGPSGPVGAGVVLIGGGLPVYR